jgi:predicted SprT family Zn-dependent metalloprotease
MATVGKMLRATGLVEEVKDCLSRLGRDDHCDYEELAAWTFKWNTRAVGRFGQCDNGNKIIEVSAILRDLPEDFRLTFLHEIAHALDYMIHGRSSHHGRKWQQIMYRGFRLYKGHSMEAERAARDHYIKMAKYTWRCTRCGEHVPLARKRKREAHWYRHGNGCNGEFEDITGK